MPVKKEIKLKDVLLLVHPIHGKSPCLLGRTRKNHGRD